MKNPIAELAATKGPAAALKVKEIFDAAILVVKEESGLSRLEAEQAFFFYAAFLAPNFKAPMDAILSDFATAVVHSQLALDHAKAADQIDNIVKGPRK